ncbi:hypothetical protein [Corynebacterium parakroppenstedtii]|uniref:hypothetical protein n=1 Tax=Corynebacterium parakroppenstedtii TaxID=2828363 RepID=UPI001C8D794B|nr:hypothetical protein [Corynebacterium parakroppenstedtii]MBY0788523.1 hypothetical protein [Corynebacterium parakroppenstedtii]
MPFGPWFWWCYPTLTGVIRGGGHAPNPNTIVETNHGAPTSRALKAPLPHRGHEAKPPRYAVGLEKGLVSPIGGVIGYTGCMTRDPVFRNLIEGQVIWGNAHLFSLAGLAPEEITPKS